MTSQRARIASVSTVGLALWLSGYLVNFNWSEIIRGLPQMWVLIARMLTPQWSYAANVLDSLWVTLQMAVVASIVGTLLAIPISILAAANTSPHPVLYRLVRSVMAVTRTIPHIIWAALLVTVFSFGQFPGIVALVISTCNMVTKLLSEYIENIPSRLLEATSGLGASYPVIVYYGVFPTVINQMWGLFFFSLEVNIRAATVLGMVGAGGIGHLLWRDLNILRYDRLATLIAILFVTVACIDLSSYLARRLTLRGIDLWRATSYRSYRLWQGLKLGLGVLVLFFVTQWVWGLLGISSERFLLGLRQSQAMLKRMMAMDFTYWYRLQQGAIESLAVAVFATIVGSLLAIPMAFLSAMNLWSFKPLPLVNKLAINLLRTFPAIILAIMFFRGLGPGPLAGALALTIYTTGIAGKLYTEIVENVDSRLIESVGATGASPLQVVRYGLWPQVAVDFLATSLYRLESNIRSATVLGIIGAGGIGTYLMMNLSARNWERVGLLLTGMIVLNLMVDWVSSYLRRRLIFGTSQNASTPGNVR